MENKNRYEKNKKNFGGEHYPSNDGKESDGPGFEH